MDQLLPYSTMDRSPYIEADSGRNRCRKFQVSSVPILLPGERTNIQNSARREEDSRQEKIRCDPHPEGDICDTNPASIRRQFPILSPRHMQKESVVDQQSISIRFDDLSASSQDEVEGEDQWVLRRSDAWSEDSMDSHSLPLSSCVEQNCVYHFQRNHSMLADSLDECDDISLHCVHWEDRLLEGPETLLTYYAC